MDTYYLCYRPVDNYLCLFYFEGDGLCVMQVRNVFQLGSGRIKVKCNLSDMDVVGPSWLNNCMYKLCTNIWIEVELEDD